MAVNKEWRDAQIAHQIALLRLSGSINNRIIQLLDATEKEIREKLKKYLDGITNPEGVDVSLPRIIRRLKVLDESIAEIRQAAMDDALDEWHKQMTDLAQAEPAFSVAKLQAILPVLIDMVIPPPAQLRALVTAQPFQGRLLKDWADSISAADLHRIENEIRIGLVQGESIDQIARRITGSVQFNGQDGVTQVTRNQAESLTRTAVMFFADAARQEFFEANKDIFEKQLYVAVLDNRTTAFCRAHDGKTYPVGQGPTLPAHWNCRSIYVALVTEEAIGTRPFKTGSEKQFLKEFTEQEGIPNVSTREDLPHGTKRKFDDYARKRARELTGSVPAKTTYGEFLRRQSIDFQNEVLGPTRAKLFRDGKLPLDRFVDRAGNELTLRQLVLRDSQAFKDAGLDPDDF